MSFAGLINEAPGKAADKDFGPVRPPVAPRPPETGGVGSGFNWRLPETGGFQPG